MVGFVFFLFRQGFRSGFSIVVVGRVCGSGLSSVFVGREFRSGLSVGFCGRGRCVRSGFSVGSSFGFAVKVFQSGLSGVVWFVEFVEQGRLKAFGGVALLLKLFCALQSVEGTQQMTNHIHASTRASGLTEVSGSQLPGLQIRLTPLICSLLSRWCRVSGPRG